MFAHTRNFLMKAIFYLYSIRGENVGFPMGVHIWVSKYNGEFLLYEY